MKTLAGLICAAVLAVGCSQTDSGITTSVKSKFAADDLVKAYQIDVDTSDHVVTLRGEVDSTAASERAMQLARDTDGVRDVINELLVTETAATSGDVDVDVDGDADVDADIDLGDDARRGAEAVKEGAEEAGAALKKGAERVKEGAERVIEDRDSDNDGH